jgi:hypothetical protein
VQISYASWFSVHDVVVIRRRVAHPYFQSLRLQKATSLKKTYQAHLAPPMILTVAIERSAIERSAAAGIPVWKPAPRQGGALILREVAAP